MASCSRKAIASSLSFSASSFLNSVGPAKVFPFGRVPDASTGGLLPVPPRSLGVRPATDCVEVVKREAEGVNMRGNWQVRFCRWASNWERMVIFGWSAATGSNGSTFGGGDGGTGEDDFGKPGSSMYGR